MSTPDVNLKGILQYHNTNFDADIPLCIRSIRLVGPINLPSPLLNKPEHITWLVDLILRTPNKTLYIDAEGQNLSVIGTISILQILIPSLNICVLIDTYTLQQAAFDTETSIRKYKGLARNLRGILAAPDITKIFFDVRNDSNALFGHFKVALDGVRDIQVMNSALCGKQWLNSLSTCISGDCKFTPKEEVACQSIKDIGRAAMDSSNSGFVPRADAVASDPFAERPLPTDLVRYCVMDLAVMPVLYKNYWPRLTDNMLRNVEAATEHRVVLSMSSYYVPNGRHKKIGPWNVKAWEGKDGKTSSPVEALEWVRGYAPDR